MFLFIRQLNHPVYWSTTFPQPFFASRYLFCCYKYFIFKIFVFSALGQTVPGVCYYGTQNVFYIYQSQNNHSVVCFPPRQFLLCPIREPKCPSYTTVKITIELFVLSLRPDNSAVCHWPTQNAAHINHIQNNHRAVCSQPPLRQLRSVSLANAKYPVHTPQPKYRSSLLSSSFVPTAHALSN